MESFWSKSKNDTLDPLSIIIKLYIYSYKPLGTKISISNNKLDIQEVGIFQSTTRILKGDNKNDIPILSMPILYACNTYLLTDKMKYIKLFTQASTSFDKMKETYQGNEITYNIDTLKGYVLSFINDDASVNSVNVAGSYNSNSGKIKQAIYSNIASVWTEQRIDTVFNFIMEIELHNNIDTKELLLKPLYMYMCFIDTLVHGKIADLN